MSIALTTKAVQIRSAKPENDIIAAAVTEISREIDRLGNQLAMLAKFTKDQSGTLYIDTLHIRNMYALGRFEDPVDIQSFSVATYRVTLVGEVIRLKNTSVGALTLTSLPTIAAGQNLQPIELVNVGTQNIVFQDNATLAGSNLKLEAATRTVAPHGILSLRYSSDLGFWLERFFANNL